MNTSRQSSKNNSGKIRSEVCPIVAVKGMAETCWVPTVVCPYEPLWGLFVFMRVLLICETISKDHRIYNPVLEGWEDFGAGIKPVAQLRNQMQCHYNFTLQESEQTHKGLIFKYINYHTEEIPVIGNNPDSQNPEKIPKNGIMGEQTDNP